jgi:NADH:ubiquinone oxidoreductase subunit 5 (subunit L)/multisubunit Na+/H+ antiporter MnhA subunit
MHNITDIYVSATQIQEMLTFFYIWRQSSLIFLKKKSGDTVKTGLPATLSFSPWSLKFCVSLLYVNLYFFVINLNCYSA